MEGYLFSISTPAIRKIIYTGITVYIYEQSYEGFCHCNDSFDAPSDDSSASSESSNAWTRTAPIVLTDSPETKYKDNGFTWDGSTGVMKGVNLDFTPDATDNMFAFDLTAVTNPTIKLVGTNKITVHVNNDGKFAGGIGHIDDSPGCSLTLTGIGSLEIVIEAPTATVTIENGCAGIRVDGDLVLNGCRLYTSLTNCYATNSPGIYGIQSFGKITLNNAKFYYNSSNSTDYTDDCGIYCRYFVCEDSTVDVKALASSMGIGIVNYDPSATACSFKTSGSNIYAEGNRFSIFSPPMISEVSIDGKILAGSDIGQEPTKKISVDEIIDYNVVWILGGKTPTNDIPITVSIVVLMFLAISAIFIVLIGRRRYDDE